MNGRWRNKDEDETEGLDEEVEEDPEDQGPPETFLGSIEEFCLNCTMTPCICMLLKLELRLKLLRKTGAEETEESGEEELLHCGEGREEPRRCGEEQGDKK